MLGSIDVRDDEVGQRRRRGALVADDTDRERHARGRGERDPAEAPRAGTLVLALAGQLRQQDAIGEAGWNQHGHGLRQTALECLRARVRVGAKRAALQMLACGAIADARIAAEQAAEFKTVHADAPPRRRRRAAPSISAGRETPVS